MTNGWQNTAKAALIHLLLLKTFQETTILMLTTFSVSFLHQVFSKLYYRSLFSYDSVVNSIMSLFTQQSGNLNTVTTRLPHMHVGMHWFIWRFLPALRSQHAELLLVCSNVFGAQQSLRLLLAVHLLLALPSALRAVLVLRSTSVPSEPGYSRWHAVGLAVWSLNVYGYFCTGKFPLF